MSETKTAACDGYYSAVCAQPKGHAGPCFLRGDEPAPLPPEVVRELAQMRTVRAHAVNSPMHLEACRCAECVARCFALVEMLTLVRLAAIRLEGEA